MSLTPWIERDQSPKGRKEEVRVGVVFSTTWERFRDWYYTRKFNKVLERAKAKLKKIQDETTNN